eukprot:6182463-Pleurochrysis_carterae.AAC.1
MHAARTGMYTAVSVLTGYGGERFVQRVLTQSGRHRRTTLAQVAFNASISFLNLAIEKLANCLHRWVR